MLVHGSIPVSSLGVTSTHSDPSKPPQFKPHNVGRGDTTASDDHGSDVRTDISLRALTYLTTICAGKRATTALSPF